MAGLPGATEAVLVREEVQRRLAVAVEALPHEIGLRVSDGYRPLVVQQALWDEMMATTRRLNPEWSGEQLLAQTRRFVASPEFNPVQPPPHLTGGAVDVSLICLATGEPVDVGTSMDDAHDLSLTSALEREPLGEPGRMRRVLYHAMIGAGFVNYPNEWWHYEYGTIRWAKQTGAPCAIYGGLQ
ncbi:MAG: hypothetical protein JNJ45_05165 [Chthonomonas sp.]|nr:hypothetical protein [Chthonomonas sp.]